ncbi:hypothetical protein [Aureispira anguillae]|uniref:Uncharacterized protein n=1 Tax=Aureispira anguillae TaxID=2864201 RepID=A0A915YG81_9BACT|nr:hypothetical protein [Aureispira anguillae]BDS12421.1 hypothetical protein AsAng_0031420 [Aureispira anguillae]
MKKKFKDSNSIKGFKHPQYRKLLGEFLGKNTGSICEFILKLDAQFQETDPLPFVYLGEMPQSWKNFKKENKAEKTFVAGRCFVEPLGEGFTIKMLPEVGKGAKDSTVKAVNKELKKSNIYIEFVSELPDLKTVSAEAATASQAPEEAPLEMIENGIEKYAKLYVQLQKDKEKVEEKDQALKRLKRLCRQWRAAHANGAAQSVKHAKIEKTVQQFEAFFEKRKKAKEGDDSEVDGLKAREEKLYARTLKHRNGFYQSLSSGDIRDVSIIENHLEDMKERISEWTKFVKEHNKSEFGEILKQMVADYKEASKTFNQIRKDLEAFFDNLEKQDVEKATELARKIKRVL